MRQPSVRNRGLLPYLMTAAMTACLVVVAMIAMTAPAGAATTGPPGADRGLRAVSAPGSLDVGMFGSVAAGSLAAATAAASRGRRRCWREVRRFRAELDTLHPADLDWPRGA